MIAGTNLLTEQFEFAQKTVELVLTLTTAAIGVTLIVVKDFTGKRDWLFLKTCWSFLMVSSVLGVLSLGALAGQLGTDRPSVWGVPSILALLQLITFLLGVLFGLMFRWRALPTDPPVVRGRKTMALIDEVRQRTDLSPGLEQALTNLVRFEAEFNAKDLAMHSSSVGAEPEEAADHPEAKKGDEAGEEAADAQAPDASPTLKKD